MLTEVESHDADGYVVDKIGLDQFVATLRKE